MKHKTAKTLNEASQAYMWITIYVLTQKLCCLGGCCGLWYQEGWFWLLWSLHHTETSRRPHLWTTVGKNIQTFMQENFNQLKYGRRKDSGSLLLSKVTFFKSSFNFIEGKSISTNRFWQMTDWSNDFWYRGTVKFGLIRRRSFSLRTLVKNERKFQCSHRCHSYECTHYDFFLIIHI